MNEWEKEKLNIYPLTIVMDRYGGVYSGGEFLAFNLDSNDIPPDIHGDDFECSEFWDSINEITVGKGDTIKEAYEDLKKQIE